MSATRFARDALLAHVIRFRSIVSYPRVLPPSAQYLRMTFDAPERKAEGERSSRIFARDRDTNLRKGDTFLRESSVEARNRNAWYAIGSRIAEWQEGKKSAEDARARRVERTS